MIRRLGLALALAGCVSGLEPGELGTGRLVGVFPGEVPAVLPPMTDRAGNVYVATGVPDATGAPQPGTVVIGGARGGWSSGCATGDGPRGGARGWIGATDERGWLWTEAALLALDAATGDCTPILDRDPVSNSDVTFLAVAPLVDESVSGTSAAAIVTTGTAPAPSLVLIDLDLGVIRERAALGDVTVLGAGSDAAGHALFAVRGGTQARVLVFDLASRAVATVPVRGDAGALAGELAGGSDGTLAAVLAGGGVLVGDASELVVEAAPGAVGIERDAEGALWLVGASDDEAWAAPLTRAGAGTRRAWPLARAVGDALAAGVVVLDERSGQRTATRWRAHHALGTLPLVSAHGAPVYGVGARALLVADPPVDRGGIAYSQLAIVPVGMELP